jgi:hypothetical protein
MSYGFCPLQTDSSLLIHSAVAFPLGSPSSKTELAIVEYSPEPIRDCPDPSTESEFGFVNLLISLLIEKNKNVRG